MTDSVQLADLIRTTPPADPGQPTAEQVIDATARRFGVPAARFLNGGNASHHAEPRIVAMAVLRAMTTMSYPQLGVVFGRDHSTIVSAVHRVRRSPRLMAWAADVFLDVHSQRARSRV